MLDIEQVINQSMKQIENFVQFYSFDINFLRELAGTYKLNYKPLSKEKAFLNGYNNIQPLTGEMLQSMNLFVPYRRILVKSIVPWATVSVIICHS